MQRLSVCALMALGLFVSSCGSDSSFSGSNGKATNRVAKKPAAADAQPAKPAKPSAKPPRPSTPESKPEPVPKPELANDTDSTFVPDDISTDPGLTKPQGPAVLPPAAVIPQGAVTKGSFTVWTTPADPQPFESYTITIEVKLPSNTTSYTASDLSGQVVGTDGYTQGIGEGGQDFQFLGATARLNLFVPGAVQAVRDTVDVRSTVLNESQSLTLEF